MYFRFFFLFFFFSVKRRRIVEGVEGISVEGAFYQWKLDTFCGRWFDLEKLKGGILEGVFVYFFSLWLEKCRVAREEVKNFSWDRILIRRISESVEKFRESFRCFATIIRSFWNPIDPRSPSPNIFGFFLWIFVYRFFNFPKISIFVDIKKKFPKLFQN